MSYPGYLQVVATIDASVNRDEFDEWYETVHLPQVIERLDAITGCRMWSLEDPNVHYALYKFESAEFMIKQVRSARMRDLVADFDARWGYRVTRRRTTMTGVSRRIA